MESKTICSSEDLSPLLDACKSSSFISGHASHKWNVTGNRYLTVFPPNSRKLKNYQSFKDSLRKDSYLENHRNADSIIVKNVKSPLKIASEKLKLIDKQTEKTGIFSVKAKRNLVCSRKECKKIICENEGTKFEDDSFTFQSDDEKCDSNEKRIERVEIEVFMPTVDIKMQKITYPETRKPLIKRYFKSRNNYYKSKDGLKIKHLNKKDKGTSVKKMPLKPKLKQKTQEIDIKNLNKIKNRSKTPKNMNVAIRERKLPIDENKKNLEKEKATEIFQNSSFESIENVQILNHNIIKKHTNWIRMHMADSSAKTLPKKSFENHCYINKSSKYLNKNKKCFGTNLSNKIAFNENPTHNNTFPCTSNTGIAKDNLNLLKERDLSISTGLTMCNHLQETVTKPIFKSSKVKLSSRNLQLNHLQNIPEKYDMELIPTKKVCSESGWRRIDPVYPKGYISVSKRLRRLADDDGLSIESWIDRCKYLQAREKYLGAEQSSRWRTS